MLGRTLCVSVVCLLLLTVYGLLASPNSGGPLGDINLSGLEGRTAGTWCRTKCYNCDTVDPQCSEDTCTRIASPTFCDTQEYRNAGQSPELCDETYGNATCEDPPPNADVFCFDRYRCWCLMKPGTDEFECTQEEWVGDSKVVEPADIYVCDFETRPGASTETCDAY